MLNGAYRWVRAAGLVGVIALCGVALWRQSRGNIVAGIYRQRLEEVSARYQELRGQYNEAVRKTAVTELVVSGGQVSVVVRTAAGIVETIPTHLDAAQEVHVEYLVLDGKLWIRRVYTLSDPDSAGQAAASVAMINPSLASPPWSTDPNLKGLSIFRKDLTAGRWVVTTTGNAALDLRKLPEGQCSQLASPPPVRDFPAMEAQIRDEVARLGVIDIARNILAEP
jgi:hypothetical protein